MISTKSINNRKGFSIVELLIAIVILAILSTIGVVAYRNIQERAYSARVISAVDTYSKALKMYHIQNGRFPDYGTGWGTCLGRVTDYPPASIFPAGSCFVRGDGTDAQYANDNLYDELKTIISSMPDPTTKVASSTNYGPSGGTLNWRGIYYEHQNNEPQSNVPDWAYVEYVVKGNVPCPHSYSSGYNESNDVTFCSTTIWALDGGTT